MCTANHFCWCFFLSRPHKFSMKNTKSVQLSIAVGQKWKSHKHDLLSINKNNSNRYTHKNTLWLLAMGTVNRFVYSIQCTWVFVFRTLFVFIVFFFCVFFSSSSFVGGFEVAHIHSRALGSKLRLAWNSQFEAPYSEYPLSRLKTVGKSWWAFFSLKQSSNYA